MRRSFGFVPPLLFAAALLWTALLGVAAQGAAVPKLEGRVNDYAHVLSPQQKSQLESALAAEESQSSNQVVVLTIPSLDGDTIEDFADRVFRAWKLGQKGKDNGVLLVVAVQDHKMRIEVGYGLEGALTDALSSEIIRNEMAPRFRAGDFDGGILAGVTAIDKAIHGEYKSTRPHQVRQFPHANVGLIFFWMMFFIIFLISHLRFGRYRNHWLGPYWISTGSSGGFSGGGFSGGGGGFSGGGGGSGGGGASGGW